jgi:very-short-patch-repair endonuclease
MLRDYLRYVESGGTDLGTHIRESSPLNPFERDVLEQLTSAGLQLDCQVGCSDYWIDFAAKDSANPGRYVLAIEADGATYHSAETARDRDRLRQDHLERLGWRFCRIWSTDWFHHREREVARVVAAYREALAAPAQPITTVRRSDPSAENDGGPGTPRAVLAAPQRKLPPPWRPDGRPITEYPNFELVRFMRWIMSDDVPRTTEELVAIGTKALGFKSRGSRIRAALERAIAEVRVEEQREQSS